MLSRDPFTYKEEERPTIFLYEKGFSYYISPSSRIAFSQQEERDLFS